jgi:hypothetical protein
VPLVQQVLEHAQPRRLHALFDAGVGKSAAGVRVLWDLAEQHPNVEVTLPALPHRLRCLEAIAQRLVRVERRARRVPRRYRQGLELTRSMVGQPKPATKCPQAHAPRCDAPGLRLLPENPEPFCLFLDELPAKGCWPRKRPTTCSL